MPYLSQSHDADCEVVLPFLLPLMITQNSHYPAVFISSPPGHRARDPTIVSSHTPHLTSPHRRPFPTTAGVRALRRSQGGELSRHLLHIFCFDDTSRFLFFFHTDLFRGQLLSYRFYSPKNKQKQQVFGGYQLFRGTLHVHREQMFFLLLFFYGNAVACYFELFFIKYGRP